MVFNMGLTNSGSEASNWFGNYCSVIHIQPYVNKNDLNPIFRHAKHSEITIKEMIIRKSETTTAIKTTIKN